MVKFSQGRDSNLHEALLDVKTYLQEHHRFEEKSQEDVKFKEQDLLVDFVSPFNTVLDQSMQSVPNETTDLPLDSLRLTTSTGIKLSPTKNQDSIMHTLPKQQLKEQKLLQEKFALARQKPGQSPKPMWMVTLFELHNVAV